MIIKTKLFIIFSIFIFLILSVMSIFTYKGYTKFLLTETKSNLESIASIISINVDGDLHQKIVSEGSKKNIFYKDLQYKFQSIIKNNPKIKYIYTIIKTNDNKVLFVIDSDPDGDIDINNDGIISEQELDVKIGEEYEVDKNIKRLILNSFFNPTVTDSPYTDKWGTFLSGFAPFYNRKDEVKGVVGVDIDISTIQTIKKQILKQILFIFLILILINFFIVKISISPILKFIKIVSNLEDIDNILDNEHPKEYKIVLENIKKIIKNNKLHKDRLKIVDKLSNLVNNHAINSDTCLQISLEIFLEITNANKGIIFIYNNDNQKLEMGARKNLDILEDKNILQEIFNLPYLILKENSICNLYKNQVITNENVNVDENLQFINQIMNKTDCHISFPLIINDLFFGFIFVDKINEDRTAFDILIDQISLIIENLHLYKVSTVDSLTQIYSRKHILSILEKEMINSKSQNIPLSLIMLDIDFFKKINDEVGHIKGDFVLEKVAEILKDNSRKNDLIGRYGGEEFIMVLPKVNIENANFVAEKLRKKVEDSNILKDKKVTISLGISLYENEESIKDFIEKSDLALYEAKKTRNKCVVYSKNLKDES